MYIRGLITRNSTELADACILAFDDLKVSLLMNAHMPQFCTICDVLRGAVLDFGSK